MATSRNIHKRVWKRNLMAFAGGQTLLRTFRPVTLQIPLEFLSRPSCQHFGCPSFPDRPANSLAGRFKFLLFQSLQTFCPVALQIACRLLFQTPLQTCRSPCKWLFYFTNHSNTVQNVSTIISTCHSSINRKGFQSCSETPKQYQTFLNQYYSGQSLNSSRTLFEWGISRVCCMVFASPFLKAMQLPRTVMKCGTQALRQPVHGSHSRGWIGRGCSHSAPWQTKQCCPIVPRAKQLHAPLH